MKEEGKVLKRFKRKMAVLLAVVLVGFSMSAVVFADSMDGIPEGDTKKQIATGSDLSLIHI